MNATNHEFIEAAFRELPEDEAPWVTGFPGDPASAPGYFWGGRPVRGGLPAIIQPTNNNYVCISTFRRQADGTWRRRKSTFAAMRVVMIDDIGTKVPAENILLEPGALVETSPGNCQAWYFLDPPERDQKRAALLLTRMIASGLCADAKDPGMSGVTRYGRLPAGVNAKAKYVEALKAPFVQRVLAWHPERLTSIEALAAAYGIDLTPEPGRRRPRLSGGKHADTLVQTLDELGLYTAAMDSLPGAHQIVCPWVHEHTDQDESGTVYFAPSDENAGRGGFKCHHGHCIDRGVKDLQHFVRAAERIEKTTRSGA